MVAVETTGPDHRPTLLKLPPQALWEDVCRPVPWAGWARPPGSPPGARPHPTPEPVSRLSRPWRGTWGSPTAPVPDSRFPDACFSSRWFLQASGILKGFDPLLNLVLDGTVEYMRDPDDQYKLTEDTRQLGLVVCRGTSVVLICPQDGMEAIPNPFIQQQDA